jgi:hypothetical protein
MRDYVPGTFQWDRAHTFLLQCEQPMRRDIEPAMFWRLLPPLVAHALRLPGKTPFALPWLGVLVATGYVAVLFRRRLEDWRWIAGGTILYATTSAVIVPVGWLGINDAWVWLGLLAVAFGKAPWATPLACLLCPWVDERFVIGFPLAWLVRRCDAPEGWSWRAVLSGLWLAPYAALRIWLMRNDGTVGMATQNFLSGQIRSTAGLAYMIPLGWWMGLWAAWAGVAYAGLAVRRDLRLTWVVALAGTAVVSVILASDLSRSIAIIMPVVLQGCFSYARIQPGRAPKLLLALGIINLLIPAVHVVYTKIDLINPLPVEIVRLFRHPSS